MSKRKVTIVGCGVSGLTTAVVLQEAGHEVRIVTARLPAETVSARAAALWFPFQVGPADKANAWSKLSYERFQALAAVPGAGVHMWPLVEVVDRLADAWWQDAIPPGAIRRALPSEVPAAFAHKPAFYITVPIIETPVYLQWLMDHHAALGGAVEVADVRQIADLPGDCVVNCTGLGARELVGDGEMYAIRGQVVKVAPHAGIPSLSADMALWGSDTELAYVIPRSDCIVLGGTAQLGNESLAVDVAEAGRIRDRCMRLDPRLADLAVMAVEVGLRPGRKSIRLEREGRVIHNYGHGGGGYTVSWGCAEEVLSLLEGH